VLQGFGVELLKQIIGIYIRVEPRELSRLREHPEILPKYDPRVALADGRGLDLGRAWEELGVFLDGGVSLPDAGATVGEVPLPSADNRATWSYIEPERVRALAGELTAMRRDEFCQRYEVDNEDTLTIPGTQTGAFGDRRGYMYTKLRELATHYAAAAKNGEGMLVRIGDRI
jgi:hypothetical protein